MTQRQFFAIWYRLRPRDFSRSKWFRLGLSIDTNIRALAMPYRRPRFWWFCMRVKLAIRFGFPLPRSDLARGILRA